ncbi:MAG: Zn-ribbon domain-containing OB-fold protein [Actinomycetia bacterium]|nr:Zn-ribbon domain-containing OB-fold protein [Actinomycetes bacterium]
METLVESTERPDGCTIIVADPTGEGGTLSGSAVAVSFRPAELEVRPDGSGNLLGSRCQSCGAHFFPIREACSGCLSRDLDDVRFSTNGTLYTYSVVRQSTPAFEVPYVLGYVDLPEGVRIMGQITGCPIEDISIGMAVEMVLEPFGTDDDGNPLTGFRFRPAEAS